MHTSAIKEGQVRNIGQSETNETAAILVSQSWQLATYKWKRSIEVQAKSVDTKYFASPNRLLASPLQEQLTKHARSFPTISSIILYC